VMDNITSDSVQYNKMNAGCLQYVKQPGSVYTPYDIFLISYKEDINIVQQRLDDLTERVGHITHIRGVKGIFEAHKACAEQSVSKMFWVIDADADVMENFDFSHIPDVYDQDVVHVWHSENPITGEVYGYGGVKLFNTQSVREATTWGLDFTTGLSTRFKVMPQIACITRFNTDAFSTWRSAFRESVKLRLSEDSDAQHRLHSWLNPVSHSEHSSEAKLGAQQGVQFADAHKHSVSQLNMINDYDWLQSQWQENIDENRQS
jgi:hypothetical protein